MKTERGMDKRWGILAGVFLIFATLAPAKDGRDFAGFYELSDVLEEGDLVSLTFNTRVFNYSDGDVSDATVTLGDSIRLGETYATFPGVDILQRESVRLSSLVTIPRREYESWNKGASPALEIQFTDANGGTRLRRVELGRGHVREEN